MKRKIFITLSILFLSATSLASQDIRLMLEYQHGNQITSSRILVFSNGLVVTQTRQQATYFSHPEILLSKVEIQNLIGSIDLATKANSQFSEGESTSFGSSSGSLVGYSSSGKASTIFGSKLSTSGKNIQISFQIGKEASLLRSFIQNITTNKMPLDKIGE